MPIRFRKPIAVVAFMCALLLTTVCGAYQKPEPAAHAVPDNLVAFSPARNPQYAVIVEKETQTLYLFSHDNHTTRLLRRFPCSTGEAPGPKTKSGDRKTPEGVYFFTKEHLKKDLSPIYGTRAYPIDYPNILDRIAGRDGNAIWLHGTNKALKPLDSNGCIVMENSDIDALAEHITLHNTPMIVVDRLSYDTDGPRAAAETAAVSLLTGWTQALMDGTYHDFLSFYDSGYLPDISWWPRWNTLRAVIDQGVAVRSDRASMYRHRDVYVLLFDQSFHSGAGETAVGKRKLFLRKTENGYRIIGDEYLSAAAAENGSPAESPLVAVYETFLAKPEKESGIAEMIEGWLKAWSDKDIDKYGHYYARNFRSQGMNRRKWIQYKDHLNRKYAYIHVTAKDLKIEERGDRGRVTFQQTYQSPHYAAVGTKQLVLVRENGQWKIFRETWTKQ